MNLYNWDSKINKQYLCPMFSKKIYSIFTAALFIFILGNMPLPHGEGLEEGADKTNTLSNFQSRLSIQFQFQAYTNIYSEFNIEKEVQNYERPYLEVAKFVNPFLKRNLNSDKLKDYNGFWVKNKILQQLLPYHGFS